ncbi:MAG: SDR family oxidoreductase [Mesorhizobium sp.]|uniref:SDR family NAD(P)-dependent oxidoreductase n=1 Tax=unclassified Mesorhizobium TaxID=325217 RepID=UPI000FCC4F45|nr:MULTISPECIES: SDR family oxidoreductase [unclassified Mesorhizobium]RUV76384.1 SDR family oxidoreductase [Mesorhizobium sp. M5C.F.Cr.IN.023.01.1.1]RWF90283.1 MAG: SDR family oxidoreductase [Mesorhizobium sp.]RWF96475.1 MAG: SDR family oxidoreductase [Mesorhizobium sp.]RWI36356.1 MAG: SDR family oxidoreductase [Mesorhizobium sp.]RWI51370.1 MAG: SDR family oxidoreductase [Mesorhizobium sp.]
MSKQFATYPSLTDRVVLISGGASGIGADMVRAFVANGARVGFLDVQDEPAVALVRELVGTAKQAPLYLHCDVTDVAALQASVEGVRAQLGPVAVLVNNAADDQRHAVDAVTAEYWDRSFDVNLRHHFFAAQAVHPHMKELGFGSIINFSSIAWRFGADQMVAYATAKGAVVALTRALARSFGSDNIRVNAVEPGAVITERQRELWFKTQDAIDQTVQRQLIRRVLLGEEIARTVLFLAADDSRMITKQSITVDAGLR